MAGPFKMRLYPNGHKHFKKVAKMLLFTERESNHSCSGIVMSNASRASESPGQPSKVRGKTGALSHPRMLTLRRPPVGDGTYQNHVIMVVALLALLLLIGCSSPWFYTRSEFEFNKIESYQSGHRDGYVRGMKDCQAIEDLSEEDIRVY